MFCINFGTHSYLPLALAYVSSSSHRPFSLVCLVGHGHSSLCSSSFFVLPLSAVEATLFLVYLKSISISNPLSWIMSISKPNRDPNEDPTDVMEESVVLLPSNSETSEVADSSDAPTEDEVPAVQGNVSTANTLIII